MKPKRFNLTDFSVEMGHLKDLKVGFGGGIFDMEYTNLALQANLCLVTVKQPNSS
jgi:hypothetical protein